MSAQLEVLIKERLDGTDVLPVSIEWVRNYIHVLGCKWNDLPTKVIGRGEFLHNRGCICRGYLMNIECK
jgi:hypothetical protein